MNLTTKEVHQDVSAQLAQCALVSSFSSPEWPHAGDLQLLSRREPRRPHNIRKDITLCRGNEFINDRISDHLRTTIVEMNKVVNARDFANVGPKLFGLNKDIARECGLQLLHQPATRNSLLASHEEMMSELLLCQ